jgi:hypothetical protein
MQLSPMYLVCSETHVAYYCSWEGCFGRDDLLIGYHMKSYDADNRTGETCSSIRDAGCGCPY